MPHLRERPAEVKKSELVSKGFFGCLLLCLGCALAVPLVRVLLRFGQPCVVHSGNATIVVNTSGCKEVCQLTQQPERPLVVDLERLPVDPEYHARVEEQGLDFSPACVHIAHNDVALAPHARGCKQWCDDHGITDGAAYRNALTPGLFKACFKAGVAVASDGITAQVRLAVCLLYACTSVVLSEVLWRHSRAKEELRAEKAPEDGDEHAQLSMPLCCFTDCFTDTTKRQRRLCDLGIAGLGMAVDIVTDLNNLLLFLYLGQPWYAWWLAYGLLLAMLHSLGDLFQAHGVVAWRLSWRQGYKHTELLRHQKGEGKEAFASIVVVLLALQMQGAGAALPWGQQVSLLLSLGTSLYGLYAAAAAEDALALINHTPGLATDISAREKALDGRSHALKGAWSLTLVLGGWGLCTATYAAGTQLEVIVIVTMSSILKLSVLIYASALVSIFMFVGLVLGHALGACPEAPTSFCPVMRARLRDISARWPDISARWAFFGKSLFWLAIIFLLGLVEWRRLAWWPHVLATAAPGEEASQVVAAWVCFGLTWAAALSLVTNMVLTAVLVRSAWSEETAEQEEAAKQPLTNDQELLLVQER